MSRRLRPTRSICIAAAFVVAALGLVGLLGCGGDKATNPNPNPGSTTYTGSVSGTGASGKLTITLATSSPAPQNAGYRATAVVTATGTFTPSGGAPITLSGFYDDVAKVVGLTGGNWAFGGELTGSRIDGGASGPANELGYFTLVQGSAEVTVIIGRYTSTTMPLGENGHFNISVSGTEVHGNAVSDDGGTAIPLDGTYSSSTGDISIVNPGNPTGPPFATGNYNSTTGNASGAYDDGAGSSGTWAGARQ